MVAILALGRASGLSLASTGQNSAGRKLDFYLERPKLVVRTVASGSFGMTDAEPCGSAR